VIVQAVFFVLWFLLLPGCSTVPMVDGRRASEVGSEEVFLAASDAFRAGQYVRAADLAEYLLRTDFRFDQADRVRFLAAEARYLSGDYESSLAHDRRLMEEDPLTPFGEEIAIRAYAIGKHCVEQPTSWFGDFDRLQDVGVEALTFLVTQFPRNELADDGWKELGETFQLQREYRMAADAFERLAGMYPDSEWVDLALFQAAESYRALSSGPEFDLDVLLFAHAAYGRYLDRYPDGNFVVPARETRSELEEEVGVRELTVAAFYESRGSLDGARIHLTNAALRFPHTEAAELARILLQASGWEQEFAALGAHSTDVLRPRQDRPPWAQAPESPDSTSAAGANRRPRK